MASWWQGLPCDGGRTDPAGPIHAGDTIVVTMELLDDEGLIWPSIPPVMTWELFAFAGVPAAPDLGAPVLSRTLSASQIVAVSTSIYRVTLLPEDTAGLVGTFIHAFKLRDVAGVERTPNGAVRQLVLQPKIITLPP